ncbi:MAG: hypothetical protein AAF762_02020 [Pseudomonadota bacterium]
MTRRLALFLALLSGTATASEWSLTEVTAFSESACLQTCPDNRLATERILDADFSQVGAFTFATSNDTLRAQADAAEDGKFRICTLAVNDLAEAGFSSDQFETAIIEEVRALWPDRRFLDYGADLLDRRRYAMDGGGYTVAFSFAPQDGTATTVMMYNNTPVPDALLEGLE